MKSKKIAFLITSTGWGGLEMNVLKMARLLVLKEYRISLISTKESTLYINGREIFDSNFLLKKPKKYFDFIAAKKVANHLKYEQITKLLAFNNEDLDLVSWTNKLFVKNLKVIFHQQMQIGRNKKTFFRTFRYQSINIWITPLNYLKKQIGERTNYPLNKVEVIPLSTNIKNFIPAKYSIREARLKLGISAKLPLVGIIGRVSEKKGQLFMVEALLKLKDKGVHFELLIFGSATVNDNASKQYYQTLLKVITDKKLQNLVHLVPHQADVSLFYNSIDIFALGSESETFGMVTIEAMLSKVPIIATQSGGTSEILDYGRLGQLYEYENYADFSDKLTWMLAHKECIHTTALAAQKVAEKSYNQDNEIDKIDKLIAQL